MQYHTWAKPDCTVVLGHLEKNIAAALAPMMDKNVAGLISAGNRDRAMKLLCHLWFGMCIYVLQYMHKLSSSKNALSAACMPLSPSIWIFPIRESFIAELKPKAFRFYQGK